MRGESDPNRTQSDLVRQYERSMRAYRVGTILFTALAILMAFATLYPYLFSILASLRKGFDIYSVRFKWSDLTFYAYERILFGLKSDEASITIWPWMLNSLILSVSITSLMLLISAMGGYALARIQFPGKKFWFTLLLGVMMVPGQVTLVTRYIMITKVFGWMNSYQGLIVPFVFSAYYTFMMRQFFLSFPKELEEAAIMDGMSRVGVFFRMLLPLSKAPLLAAGTLIFMGSWGSYLWPKLLITKASLFPISLGMTMMMGSKYRISPALPMAAAIITMLPLLLLFAFFQKYFMQSITSTGAKGS